ncbi:SDR family NAD(P)-dependent oxidoreductase [Microbacterium sp. 18062]|uniref:SDR family NAD(P)-dependent oxidoreductase n=1 Tax=Microbacterium sp. 18062 TaxID=2681410 RepID=UPI00135AF52B|nr:SDR family oxidoreductase [Microbacterium sp. 18062]
MGLEGRIAVITGAARGIGRHIAEHLARAGADVASIDLAPSDDTVAAVTAAGRRGVGIVADVTSPEALAAAAERVRTELGDASILVNNAGLHPRQTLIDDVDYELWQRTMRVNIDSMFLVSKAFLPQLRSGGSGRIINMSSSVANVAPLGGVHYITSKAAVVGLTRGLARELGPDGVTVNAIAPSIVQTPGLAGTGISPEIVDAVLAQQIVQDFTTPDDLVGLVTYLCTHEARLFTGQHFHLDGGIVLGD